MQISNIKKRLEKVKVIYTDVDNTFVTEGCLFKDRKGYTLKNAAAIYELLNMGIDIVMNSARNKEKLKDIARLLGFRNYIANMGMEIVYNNGEKVVKNYGADIDNPYHIKSMILDTGIVDFLFLKYKGKVRYYKPWSDDLKTHPLMIGKLPIKEVQSWIEVHYPSLRIIDNGLVPKEDNFEYPHAYHIVPKDVGKKHAVQIDKKIRELRKGQLVGIGDSYEDMTMAHEVGIYFALDHSVKFMGKYKNVVYIDSDDECGLSEVIQFLRQSDLI